MFLVLFLAALMAVAGVNVLGPAGTLAAATRHHAPPAPRRHPIPPPRPPAPGQGPTLPAPSGRASPNCPWASPGALAHSTPARLAAEVASHLTLEDELDLVDLAGVAGYENSTAGIPSLCVPPLTLQDGPEGLSRGDTGVTQLSSSLALAATFDPALAEADGSVVGDEARRQGIDVVQGPMLNLDRVPEDGRAFETFGEDPRLAAVMGVADIDGIQDQGVMADAKHLAVYTQESDRHGLDQIVTARQLEELYLLPFQAAVQQAHVASVMCAYGEIDGQPTCADPSVYRLLESWGFDGFVRSDMSAVHEAVPAFDAGMDAIKPAQPRSLDRDVTDHRLAEGVLGDAAERLLTEMFRFDLIARPLTGMTDTAVDSAAHAAVDLEIAEASAVLLKDRGAVLPLDFARLRSIAVIGGDAGKEAATAGLGGGHVKAPFVVEPVSALAGMVRPGGLHYAPGGTGLGGTQPIPPGNLELAAGSRSPLPRSGGTVPGSDASPADGVASPEIPADGTRSLHVERGVLETRSSGWYDLSVKDDCPTWLLLDGRVLFDTPARHEPFTWSRAVDLQAGRRYRIELEWRPMASGDVPALGWRDVTSELAAAVRLARSSEVAVVFASDYSAEGMDRPDLQLPGDENQLISEVAAANPRTVVVLNTAGPVLMPWLSKVAAVVEAWYPGEEDGAAITAVLSGREDPSGRLPVTFPASEDAVPAHTLATWPGIDSRVQFSEGLDIGYRWDQANHVLPLFPFGFGLSYTTFRLSDLELTGQQGGGASLSVRVTNTGHRSGTEVVQAYLSFPSAAAEPPWQLEAFARVSLRPGASAEAFLQLPASAFESWHGGWRTVSGRYLVRVGTSADDLPLGVALDR